MNLLLELCCLIFLCEVFFIVNKTGFTNCINSNTPFISEDTPDNVLEYLENTSAKKSSQATKFRKTLIPFFYS